MSSPLTEINERARTIFARLVESYLETGDPVGSRVLAKKLQASLSPASIRNVMQDLEEGGFLYAPHISAGRVPSEKGLRFFVDALLEFGSLTDAEKRDIDGVAAAQSVTLETMLASATQRLAGLSKGAGVVMTSQHSKRLKHIEFVRLDNQQALVVLVSEDGEIENRLIPLPQGLPASALIEASNFLNRHITGKNLVEAKQNLEQHLQKEAARLDSLTHSLIQEGIASWAGGNGQKKQLIVHGQSQLLNDVKALEDLERVRQLLADLEAKQDVIDLLGKAENAEGVRIYIGSENQLFSLSGSSLIVSPYRDKEKKVIGVVGVIGPTRLNYAKIVPVVDYTAKIISSLSQNPRSHT